MMNEDEDPAAECVDNPTPLSELGCAPTQVRTNDPDDKWRMLLEQQNRNFLALIQAMKGPSIMPVVHLPEFDPEKTNVDARAWLSTADMCMADNPLTGASLMIALSQALKGTASAWLSQISYPGMTWKDFQEAFTSRYDSPETAAATLINLFNSKPKEGECLATYAATQLNALLARWKNMSTEQIAVATVMSHISQFEPRVNRLAFTSEISTRNKLQQELKALSYLKRKASPSNDRSNDDMKRRKFLQPTPTVKCAHCGKIGHHISVCRFKKDNYKKENRNPGTSHDESSKPAAVAKPSSSIAPVTCFNCGGAGHYSSRCPRPSNRNANKSSTSTATNPAERRVDQCTVETPKGILQHSSELFSFCYDSGAECSLIRESISSKFQGKRFHNTVKMTGIGHTSVYSTSQILSVIKIDDINLEVLFHVLPDKSLRHNIMIGHDVLSLGLEVHLTSDSVHFSKTMTINACHTTNSDPISFDDIDTDIPAEFRPKLLEILNEFKDNFVNGTPTGFANTDPVVIRLVDPHKTVCRRPYRLSPQERTVVREKIDELLAAKVIRPSTSPFASPILLVKKKDGTDRMCVDYRELNDNTVPDRFPLPLISDQIDRLHGCHYFTTLDMAAGFHQLPVHPESIEKTAFVTPEGHYEYLTMPFGLRNAPAAFQRAVNKALGLLSNTHVVAYMDDILVIGSSDVNESLERIRTVLRVLTESGFSFKLSKCSFMKERVEYLGYEVSRGEVRPNSKKIEALIALPPPKTVTQLRQFIGLASYFRQFVPKFAHVMAPLYALTSIGKGNIEWKPEHEAIRQEIITTLTNEPVLMIFDPNSPIELHTDASAIGYGAILIQKRDGKNHAVAYFSKRTSPAESRYHSYELETLAVVNAVKYFKHYLHGNKFTIVTDCNALKSSHKKVDLTPRVHRWWAFLQAYDFEVVYRDGKRMCHADFLSRNPLPPSPFERVEQRRVDIASLPEHWLKAEQQKDPNIVQLIQDLNDHKMDEHIAKTYEVRSSVLYRKIQRNNRSRWLPIVPQSLRWSVINTAHESLMHVGWEKTLEKIYDLYWFEHMAKFVRKFVENCVTCAISKSQSGKIQAEMHPIPKTPIPWHTLHIDATGKLSGKNDKKEYVFVIIDAFTKFVILHHTLRIDTASSVKALKSSISLFGAPRRVIADQGRCFASSDFKDFCQSHSIELHLIATGSSRANGQVERVMSTLKGMLTAVETSNERSWQDALPDVQLALNCTMNRVTKSSPLELLIGKVARPLELLFANDEDPEISLDDVREQAVHNIDKNSRYDKERFDSTKAKIKKFNVGDHVLLQNEERNQTKLDPKYKGPFVVSEILEGDRYVLKSLNSNRSYKYSHDRLRKMPTGEVPPESPDDLSDEHETE